MLLIKEFACLFLSCVLLIQVNARNSSSIREFYRVDAEKVPTKLTLHETNANQNKKPSNKKNRLVGIIRNLLNNEVKKIKNSITDSVMEEVINYYGNKFATVGNLRNEVSKLNQKFSELNETVEKLETNYKHIVKSHQNLVNTVRNSISNAKRIREKYLKLKFTSAMKRKSLRDKIEPTNTRALSENLNQKPTTKTMVIEPEALKLQLIKDLETKYSSVIGNSLTSTIVKKLNDKFEDNLIEEENELHDNSRVTSNLIFKETENLDPESEVEIYAPNDCQDLSNNGFKNGVNKIFITGSNKSFDVYCEFENGIGWTVLQRRHDGSVDFNQNWSQYKKGFGDIFDDHEFWLGLENMHSLTNQFNYSLQIIMTDWRNQKYIAEYSRFKIANESSKYKVEIGGYFTNSTAGDSFGDSMNTFQSHNNMAFSTYDSDNDMRFYDNCAKIFKSGWWFNACFQANLNGAYYRYSDTEADTGNTKSRRLRQEENSQLRFLRNGIHWNSIDFYKSLKATKLRVRRNE